MLEILYEDSDILVVKKPAGVPTQSANIRMKDMVSYINEYLHKTDRSAALGLVHRLDQPVEGILVFGKNKSATANLNKQITENQMQKDYYALVHGKLSEAAGSLIDYMKKEEAARKAIISCQSDTQAKKAELSYEVIDYEKSQDISLVRIHLITGRFHQIRLQFSNLGNPLLGDKKYGTKEDPIKNVALCAYRLSFKHPKTNKELSYEITPQNPAFHGFFDR